MAMISLDSLMNVIDFSNLDHNDRGDNDNNNSNNNKASTDH